MEEFLYVLRTEPAGALLLAANLIGLVLVVSLLAIA